MHMCWLDRSASRLGPLNGIYMYNNVTLPDDSYVKSRWQKKHTRVAPQVSPFGQFGSRERSMQLPVWVGCLGRPPPKLPLELLFQESDCVYNFAARVTVVRNHVCWSLEYSTTPCYCYSPRL